jgi:hypothetical protein
LIRTVLYWDGVETLLREGKWFDIGSVIAVCLLVAGVFLAATVYFVKNWGRLDKQQKRYIWIAVFWYLIPVMFSQWLCPGYDKLWIQPVMAYIFYLSIFMSDLIKRSGKRNQIRYAITGVVFLIVLANLFYLILPKHNKVNILYLESIKISKFISEKDLIITNGWDSLPTYLENFTDIRVVFLSDIVMKFSNSQDNILAELDKVIKGTLDKGGKVYFLGLFEDNDIILKLKFKKEGLKDYYSRSQLVESLPVNEKGNMVRELRIYKP